MHEWLRLEFFVSNRVNRMSVEFSRNTIIPGGKFDVPGEKFRLIEKEKQFILENLSKARIDNASKYGRRNGVKSSWKKKTLNSTCFARSKTSVKGKDIQI